MFNELETSILVKYKIVVLNIILYLYLYLNPHITLNLINGLIGSNSKLYRIRFAKSWAAAYNTQQEKLDEIDKRIKDQIAGYEIELKYGTYLSS